MHIVSWIWTILLSWSEVFFQHPLLYAVYVWILNITVIAILILIHTDYRDGYQIFKLLFRVTFLDLQRCPLHIH